MTIDETLSALRAEAKAIKRAGDRLWTDQEISLVTGQRTPAEAVDQAAQLTEIKRRLDHLAEAVRAFGKAHS